MHLIDVVRGKATDRVAAWNHAELSVFGIGAELDEATWRSVFRQLVALGYARPDHDSYGALRLTEASRPVLRGEQRVEMRRPALRKGKAPRKRLAPGPADMDMEIFEKLKTWRTAQARSQAVPPYVVFHDATLAAIAAARPRDLDALSSIAGIGARKLERYGPALLELLQLE
jgi:ATP-dependent DNA helicase RecQ